MRDRYNTIASELKAKLKREETASGINTEMSEVEKALEEIINKEQAAEKSQQEVSDTKMETETQERLNATEIRNRAMEKLWETQKRKAEQNEHNIRKKKISKGIENGRD